MPEPFGVEDDLRFTTSDVPEEVFHFSIDGESFQVIPWLTGSQYLRYSRMMMEGGVQSVVLIEDFFRDIMDPPEHERFVKFIEDPSRRVSTDILGDIFLKLFARYGAGPKGADRPTQPSKRSPLGREATGGTSKASSSSGESTPAT